MACDIVGKQGGLITVRISGLLKWAEFAQTEKAAIEAMRAGGKVRFLILTENFQGWDSKGDWGGLLMQTRYDDQIEKIAIVGEPRWQELVEVFTGKGLRSVEIRYFTPLQAALAKAWVA
jgi:hypothetical protein